MDILGLQVTMCAAGSDGPVVWVRPDAKKMEFWRTQLNEVLVTGILPYRAAFKLAGRLSFGVFAAWGIIARQRLRSLRQHVASGGGRISADLRLDLEWWAPFLAAPIQVPRPLQPQRLDLALLYSDAEGDGGLGAVLVAPIEPCGQPPGHRPS